MKKVLIALDYDPTAQKVAEAGFSMAKSMNAKVILLHVIAHPTYYSSPEYSPIMGFTGFTNFDPFQIEIADKLKQASQYYLDNSKKHLGDNTIQTLLKEGDFAESILKAAKDMHADVIVMGSHSRKWLEDIVLGSVTEKVLKHSSIPLYIIPTKQKRMI
ncbi:MAG TPA: universal stress protein [Bacteroidales bacterium]|jgi:nucleotide-binding universal stress UspA family protein|nr:universal stress protein [Bacteroidales bacterium]HBG87164.1 universal stress protein [Marinilabiliaceae bacterium]